MKINVFFLFALVPITVFSQIITYFENMDFHEEVSKKKAKFKKVVYIKKDTTITHTIQLEGEVLRRRIKKRNGRPTGVWKTYDREGILTSERHFDSLVYAKPLKTLPWMTKDSKKNLLNFTQAQFPNGKEALASFIKKELQYPKALYQPRKINIQLFIGKEGHVMPYAIPRKADMLLEMEVWELVKKMPQWIPATKNGIPVASFLLLPVTFDSSY